MGQYKPSRGSVILLLLQVFAHAAFIYLLFVGQWWQWLVVVFVYFINGCLGMTMTYHRYLSHKSYFAPDWFVKLGTFCATIGLTGTALSWVAIHREHHRYSDQEKDPHSPLHKGRLFVHFFSMFIPVHGKYVSDLLRSDFFKWQHKWYYAINLTYAALLYSLDPMAVVYAWLAPAALLWNGGSTIVSTSHRNGKANTDVALGILVWGEGYHTHHHKEPTDPCFGKYDLGGFLIKKLFTKNAKKNALTFSALD